VPQEVMMILEELVEIQRELVEIQRELVKDSIMMLSKKLSRPKSGSV
jgi:hypothetical protein